MLVLAQLRLPPHPVKSDSLSLLVTLFSRLFIGSFALDVVLAIAGFGLLVNLIRGLSYWYAGQRNQAAQCFIGFVLLAGGPVAVLALGSLD